MISRRNYIVITMMFLILFFMFQFSEVMKERLNEYGVNKYADTTKTVFKEKNRYDATMVKNVEDIPLDRDYVVYIGEAKKENQGQVTAWWCTYTKRAFISYSSLDKVYLPQNHLPAAVVIKGEDMDLEQEGEKLREITEQGIPLIFAGMPEYQDIKENQELWDLFGIRSVMSEKVTLTGMHLFEGFLLGGEAIYRAENVEDEKRQDLQLEVPWFITGEGTKTYLVGTMADEIIKEEELPAIIWRNSVGQASVFCVNGDYLSDISGIGILEAMMFEAHSYDIYPVINAQSFTLANYPGFASENRDEMMRRYSQTQTALFRDVIWPNLVSMTAQTNHRLTCMMTPQFDYDDGNEPDGEEAAYYMGLLQEEYGEAGLSSATVSGTSIDDKLERDKSFWRDVVPEYAFLSCYLSDAEDADEIIGSRYLPDLRTIVTGYDKDENPIVSYAGDNVTLQRGTSSGAEYTFSDDIYTKSLETALGYSNIVLDMSRAAYPESEDDSWENLSKSITSNVSTYWKAFEGFSMTTLSESDQRIRRFLALDYRETREGNKIDIKLSDFEKRAWLLLRIHGEEIGDITGAAFKQIEKGVYLIEAESSHVEIELKEKKLYYYEEKR